MNEKEKTGTAVDIDPPRMMQMITGKWVSKPIFIAAELGLADRLSGGPKPVEQLAEETHADCRSLYRVLRALASLGIFSESEGRVFTNTPASNFLRDGAMRAAAMMFNAGWNDMAWLHLSEAVRSGKTPFELAHGMPLFRYLEEDPDAAAVLGEANEVKAAMTHTAVIGNYDFSRIETLVDLGGGTGALLAAVLDSCPGTAGVLAELPEVAERGAEMLDRYIEEGRCIVVECDFFESVPRGGDAYLLSNILHDWDDERCGVILSNIRKVLDVDARLLIVEMIVPPGNEPSIVKLLDLEMMVVTGGRERTEAEYSGLLEGNGLRIERIIPSGGVCLIEAHPV